MSGLKNSTNTECNLMLVGCGYHAKRIYYPVIEEYGNGHFAKITCIIDLKSEEEKILSYLYNKKYFVNKMILLSEKEVTHDFLKDSVQKKLDLAVKELGINGVIISTEPLSHMPYARWAMKRGLNVIMDKPISTKRWVATDIAEAKSLLSDFNELADLYCKAKKENPNLIFSLMAQRRYHPAFKFIKSLIKEVYEETNCSVTFVQSMHSDGQWRFPVEIIHQDYHPYNCGYGKCSHSGYHDLDIVPWLIEGAEGKDKSLDNVEIHTTFVRPKDFLFQLNPNDYRKLFSNYDDYCKYSDKETIRKMKGFGEIDAYSSFTFKHGDKKTTQANINLIHNGFAQRNWVTAEGRDLYKGNGRVRHESHYIVQGSFQAISYMSYQGEEVKPDSNEEGLYDFGGEYHLDIHVFRNDKMFPKWKNHEKYSIKDLGMRVMKGKSRGHQEDARRSAILEFIQHVVRCECTDKSESDLLDHKRSTILLSGVYQAACLREKNMFSLVTMPFKKYGA